MYDAYNAGKGILLVGYKDLPLVLQRLQNERRLKANVIGLLVMPAGSAAPSPADTCPLAAYHPYKNSSYAWNPSGTGISSLNIDIPIFHLEEGLVAATQDKAVRNMQQVIYLPIRAHAIPSFVMICMLLCDPPCKFARCTVRCACYCHLPGSSKLTSHCCTHTSFMSSQGQLLLDGQQ